MRLIIDTFIVIAIGLGLGTFATWFSINANFDIGGIRARSWLAHPFASGASVDPYTMAKTARKGTIPLGTTEGLAFVASRDDKGQEIDLACDYIVSGATPPSRLWTLSAYNDAGRPIRLSDGKVSALHSGKIVRFTDGTFQIAISSRPKSGNWLGVTGKGLFRIVLRVYDTPVTTSGFASPTMSSIVQGDCYK